MKPSTLTPTKTEHFIGSSRVAICTLQTVRTLLPDRRDLHVADTPGTALAHVDVGVAVVRRERIAGVAAAQMRVAAEDRGVAVDTDVLVFDGVRFDRQLVRSDSGEEF